MTAIANCPAGQERFTKCRIAGRAVVQYDYRTQAGELFSTVAPTVEDARIRRDKHFAAKASAAPILLR